MLFRIFVFVNNVHDNMKDKQRQVQIQFKLADVHQVQFATFGKIGILITEIAAQTF